jgi:hypothetical protein
MRRRKKEEEAEGKTTILLFRETAKISLSLSLPTLFAHISAGVVRRNNDGQHKHKHEPTKRLLVVVLL